MNKVFKWIFAIFVIASVFCGVGCKPEVEIKPTEKETGTIQGKAFYSNDNVDNHSGIQITLVSTDGLRSVAYCESRGIATNARSVSDIKTTSEDGSYSFENIPVGTYTIWASSRNSVEEAIETNVNVTANEVVTANDLNLVATGNVKGTITIDGKTDKTLGLDVFIAGTSYVAKVGPTGNYEISKVPSSKGYMLCVQKGEYTTIISEDLEVKANETIEVDCKNLLSKDWILENETQTNLTFKWLGEFATAPEDPDLYDAYYNTTDGCSYIWNGSDWDLLAKDGKDGVDGEDGKDGTNGTDGKDGVAGQSIVWKGELKAAPKNPKLYWAYYNTTDGCSYIWNGSDWDLLAKSGEDGADGKDGVAGQSIVWKGELEAAPENPELNWAYYNTTDGGSYIWNGSDWDLLTQHANHTFNEWTVTKEATCTKEGTKTGTCKVCKKEVTEKIDAKGHSFGIWEIAKDPTETESGQMKRVCKECEETETKELEGFKFVKGTTITGTESWTPESEVFVRERSLTIPDLIVSDHEVTIGEFTAVMGVDPIWWVIVYDKEVNELTAAAVLNNPVSFVSWCYAIVYCNKRSVAEGLTPCYSIKQSTNPEEWGDLPTEWDDPLLDTWDAATCDFNANGYRLPTEAEWEWLARGGQNYKYAGSDTLDVVAWYESNTDDTGPREVKTKAPNGYGLYDMSGNVFEWCWDWYGDSISSSTAADGASSGDLRVSRGGSWFSHHSCCPVVDRDCSNYPSIGNKTQGFRVVRTAK